MPKKNQDPGYFNTTLFLKHNMKLGPRLGVMGARWLSTSATSVSTEMAFPKSSILLRKNGTKQLPPRV